MFRSTYQVFAVISTIFAQRVCGNCNSDSGGEAVRELFQEFGGYGYTKHVIDSYDENEDLVMTSQPLAEAASPTGSNCSEGTYPVTIVVEPAEHLTDMYYDMPFEITWHIYRLNDAHSVGDRSPLSELEIRKTELVSVGGNFAAPSPLCLNVTDAYGLQLFATENHTTTTLDSFLYVLGPCSAGCFRPHYSAGVSGCVLGSLSSDYDRAYYLTFNSFCLVASEDAALDSREIFTEQELRDGLGEKQAGTSHFTLQRNLTMAPSLGAFSVSGLGHPLAPGLPRRVVLTSGGSCGAAGRCMLDGVGRTALFEFGAERIGTDELRNEVLVVDSLILANGSAPCGGVFKARRGSFLILRNSLVLGNRAGKGAVLCAVPTIFAGYRALLQTSHFSLNHAAAWMGLGQLTGAGGVVVCAQCTLVVRGCEMWDNSADMLGGTVALETRSSVWIYDTVFRGNAAGGSLGLQGLGMGGAVGGSNSHNGTLYIEGCSFEGNLAEYTGGALHVSDTNLWLINSSFTNNSVTRLAATSGGAVCIARNSGWRRVPALVEGCVFANNTAISGAGGALSNHDLLEPGFRHRVHVMSRCSFLGNTAEYGGAVILNLEQSFCVHASTFTDNSATSQGGAMLIEKQAMIDDAVAHVASCAFVDNSATNGGALLLSERCHLKLTDCDFAANVAFPLTAITSIWRGGAVFLKSLAVLDAHGCLFRQGASLLGGAISQMGFSSSALRSCVFKGNVAVVGGAVSLEQLSNMSAHMTVLEGNSANVSALRSSQIESVVESMDAVGGGGALLVSQNATFAGTALDVMHNTASNYGGFAVCETEAASTCLQARESRIAHNAAATGGGAVMWLEGDDMEAILDPTGGWDTALGLGNWMRNNTAAYGTDEGLATRFQSQQVVRTCAEFVPWDSGCGWRCGM
ncbi:hypothetical protein CYMTET_24666 [Cymbomonas tetramitiformis]|uniref:Uncharacterized protein n=1 Tax=Cymbomonas tetramitiformis TaxID=36881 RepID=A0AAE0L011_9CHLO|nr:hypothetical protein CYMTET_24666 [Cymbomonas tetramitiformis]